MSFKPRLKLYGKRTSEDKINTEIMSLLQGTGKRPYPLSVTQVAKTIGVSRQTIYKYIRRFDSKQTIPRSNTGRLQIPKPLESQFHKFNSHHKITSNPLVAEWMDDLLTRQGGEPVKAWKERIRSLENVCNSCKVNPDDLIVSHRKTEKIMRTFARLYKSGEAIQDPRGKKTINIRHVIYRRVQAVRDFCSFYQIVWPRGTKGIMSQRIIDHGKYADVRLTEEELEQADHFIKKTWGLDSDVYRWFWVGIESCARFTALYNMTLDYTKHSDKKTGNTTFIMTVFESKTKDIRGGKWFKYISRTDTQRSLELVKSRGSIHIHENKLAYNTFKSDMAEKLRTIYRHLGKTNSYFYNHTSHVLRHIGAHYWLSKKNYNYGLIAEIGGWNTIDELKKSYGLIPPEKILEVL